MNQFKYGKNPESINGNRFTNNVHACGTGDAISYTMDKIR